MILGTASSNSSHFYATIASLKNLASAVDDAFAEEIEHGFFARGEAASDRRWSGDRRGQHRHGSRFKGREDVLVGGFEPPTRQPVSHTEMRNGGGTRRRQTRVEAEARIHGSTGRLGVGNARQAAEEAELAALAALTVRTASASETAAPMVGK